MPKHPGRAAPVRWGIVATGAAAAAFTDSLVRLPGAEVAAVCSRSLDRARAFADRFAVPRACASVSAIAEDDSIDIVYIATPNSAHHVVAERCLLAGRAVLCEKPFTLNTDEARSLVTLARSRGVLLMDGMWMWHNPGVRLAARLVAGGAVGTVHLLQAGLGLVGPVEPGHRLRAPDLGGGALLDLGVYPVALARLLLGVPDAVTARAHLTPEGVDADTALVLEFRPTALAVLTCSIAADLPGEAIVSGTAGQLELAADFTQPDRVMLRRPGEPARTVRIPRRGDGLAHQALEAMRCVRSGRIESVLAPWQATLDVMTVVDSARAQIGVRYPTDPLPTGPLSHRPADHYGIPRIEEHT